ncbi:TIGR02452 family protein [Seinonella peptonophila]|uniref:TIGR02452 family protein n=1 Tax=Seinonella peptonophila TaxID=112248 RepID=A0A1M5B278_9BACL|nr:TIGR02452 family protein [Seinonella peptonophila]SHF36578.1 TIGR02452 family protein [Seinonella peptonophila]
MLKKQANRQKRAMIAAETLEILMNGSYKTNSGDTVTIYHELANSKRESILYRPNKTSLINTQLHAQKKLNQLIEITEETTLAAAYRLVVKEDMTKTICLNFASAKNPGGGFKGGSQAQEESLVRASGLYDCIAQMSEMYDYNRKLRTCLYSDYRIYSPRVPVFRDDLDRLLDEPYQVSFITAPAVNAGVVRNRESYNIDLIQGTMEERIRKILAIAIEREYKAIILGAFGCGVFRNHPEDVAEYFKKVLVDEGYYKYFDKIVFAIYDRSKNKGHLNAFKRVLGCD